MYTTPALADDVADLAAAMSLARINIYGVSYGTRWALEVMRRHPNLVRAAVLDAVYPPQVNGEQNEPEIVRRAFEQLYADCAADALCRERHPGLRGTVESAIEAAQGKPLELTLQLEDGPQSVRLDGPKLLMVLLHMMREGEAALMPEAVRRSSAATSGCSRYSPRTWRAPTAACSSRMPSSSTGSTTASNAARPGPRSTARRGASRSRRAASTASPPRPASRRPSVRCGAWRRRPPPSASRSRRRRPTLLLSGTYDWLTPPAWGREAARHLSSSRHVVFRAQGHGVVVQDPCAARLRDDFIEEPDPKRALPCRADTPPNFTAAYERARNLPVRKTKMNRVLAHTGVKYPIVQAPMGWIARSQLASAVSNAGGLGIIETSSGEVDACMGEIARMRELTDKPFGVNLPLLFIREPRVVDLVAASGVKFVTTSAGSPAKLLPTLKAAGLMVYHVVPNLTSALKAVDAGVDGLIVEGGEGGGFKNPDDVCTLVLLQAVRERTDVPIIAAGGICDGRGMAAAFALGAEGIQMGTRFVSSAESPVHANYKHAIVDADDTGTVMLNRKSSPRRCVAGVKTERAKEIDREGGSIARLRQRQGRLFGGDMEASLALAGQTVGLIHEVLPVADIISAPSRAFMPSAGRNGSDRRGASSEL